jgi:predicted chitinase
VNVDTLLKAMPGLSRAKAEQYLAPMEDAMRRFGITSQMRSRMWLAQTGHESVSLRYFEEIASGAAYEGRKDLGNTQPGDGKKYKGRGPIQITGRTNYTQAGAALKLPLVDKPQMAADPQGAAFLISAWWWEAHGLNPISDRGDVLAATKRINGGTNGLSDRQSRYNTCTKLGAAVIVGGAPTPPPPPPPPPFGGDDVFIKPGKDSKVRQLIYGGTQSYWRPISDGMAQDLVKANVPIIADPNNSWLNYWHDGAP